MRTGREQNRVEREQKELNESVSFHRDSFTKNKFAVLSDLPKGKPLSEWF